MRKMIEGIAIVVAVLFIFSVQSVMAQGETGDCYGDFNCDGAVAADDVSAFLSSFGRSQFFNPCPLCQDSLCPCSSTVPKTGQTTSYATGDDGDLERGLPSPNPRFTDNGDGTVTDNLTNLVWLKEANCIATNYPGFDIDGPPGDGKVTWQHALDFVAGINDGTYPNCGAGNNDWRLPSLFELESLRDMSNFSPCLTSGHPFNNVQSWYWSSTSYEGVTSWAFAVHMTDGLVHYYDKSEVFSVWPVRDPL